MRANQKVAKLLFSLVPTCKSLQCHCCHLRCRPIPPPIRVVGFAQGSTAIVRLFFVFFLVYGTLQFAVIIRVGILARFRLGFNRIDHERFSIVLCRECCNDNVGRSRASTAG